MRVALAALTVMALTACGGEAEQVADPNPESTSIETSATDPSPSPSSTPVARVSISTSCQLLIPSGQKGPLRQISPLMMGGTITQKEFDRASDALDTVRRIALTAQPELSAQLNVIAEQGQIVADNALIGSGTATDSTAYKAAGLEVITICTQG